LELREHDFERRPQQVAEGGADTIVPERGLADSRIALEQQCLPARR
jgi:hypothetical protein